MKLQLNMWSAGIVALCMCFGAHAQVAVVLEASSHEAIVGESLSLGLKTIDNGKETTLAWADAPVRWFFVRGGGHQSNRRAPELIENVASVRLEHSGVTMIGVHLAPEPAAMASADLRAMLDSELPASGQRSLAALVQDRENVVVQRHETAVTLVRASAPGLAPSGTSLSKAGLAAEIRLYADPTRIEVGSDLPIRAYAGADKPHVIVKARHVATSQEVVVETNGAGQGDVRIDRPGLWQLVFHHASASSDEGVDVDVYVASVTFEVSAGEKR